MKRLLSILLILCMVLSLAPVPAHAADAAESGTCGENLTWERFYDSTIGGYKLVISGTGPMEPFYDGSPFRGKEIDLVEIESGVTSVSRSAFAFCSIKRVKLPETLTSIDLDAFEYCKNLQEINIPDGVTSLGMDAFQCCSSLTGIVIPDSVTSMGSNAFSECTNLKSVKLSSNLTTIPANAFWRGRSLTEITVPEGVTQLGLDAFGGCSKLSSVTLPDSLTTIVDDAFAYCTSLTGITLPAGVTKIGNRTFQGCSALERLEIPDGVTRINAETFDGCTALESVTLPDGLTYLGHSVFKNCASLKSVVIPDGVPSIERSAFEGCTALETVTVPASVQSIGNNAFRNCSSLKSVTVPEGVTRLEMNTFFDCSALERISLPESLTYIGEYALAGCSSLPELTIPNGVNNIREYAFARCSSLKSIRLPNALAFMMYGMFSNCSSLERVTFPNTMKEIGPIVFTGCDALTDVYFHGTQEEWDAIKWNEDGNETALAATLHLIDHDYSDWTETTPPTCTEPGEETRTCAICGRIDTREIPALGHDPADAGVVTAPTCEAQGYTTHTCTRCGETYQDSFVEAIGHDYGDWSETKAATCTEPGEETRICANDPSHIETRPLDALGHDWSSWYIETEPTEEHGGMLYHRCFRCGEIEKAELPPKVHTHDYVAVVTEPTCTEQGYTTHTCRCGDSYVDTYVAALGHDYKSSTKEATCTEAGHTEQVICTRCGDVRKQGETIPALGHKTELRGKKDAACTAAGYTGDEVCTRCGKTIKKGSEIAAPGHQWGAWTTVKAATQNEGGVEKRTCSVCGETETRNTKSKNAQNPFRDVKDGAFYYDPVLWAVTHDPQITDGTSATTFSPNDTCTRGQVVTFLWRAKGCPEPQSSQNRFRDVHTGDYFYKAVLWAVEQGITDGTSATTFSPKEPCTRGHVVTFLWRCEGSPASDGYTFKDVPDNAYYAKAVRWAVEWSITDGTTDTTFSPNNACTRGQIVTFLYRTLSDARATVPRLISRDEGIAYCRMVFRDIQHDYPNAVPVSGYYTRYRDPDGHIATYVRVTYCIGDNPMKWTEIVLFVNGQEIHNPDAYYKKMADRYIGAEGMHYIFLRTEVALAAADHYPGGILTRDQF